MEKIPYVTPVCGPRGRARSVTAEFSERNSNFAPGIRTHPLEKSPAGFFRRLPLAGKGHKAFPASAYIFSGAVTPSRARPFSRTARTVSASFSLAPRTPLSASLMRQAL